MNAIAKVKQIFFNSQFICFLIIGGINTLSGSVFSWFYSAIMGPIMAFIPGYMSGIIVSYILNSLFTFKERLSIEKLFKFAFSTIPNFLIQFITVLIVVDILELHKLFAYALAAVVGVPVTFIILKLFVFIKK